MIQALAAGTTSSAEPTSSSTRPVSLAFFGLNRVPWLSTLTKAFWIPNIRTVRVTPPPPGSRPSDTSGKPIALPFTSAAMRWWHARAISSPPPRAAPLMAATTGLPRVSSARRSALIPSTSANISPAFSGPAVIIALRSPPAKKVFFALVTTTPVMESFSAVSRCTALCIDSL